MSSYVTQLAERARQASFSLARLTTGEKNRALYDMAAALERNQAFILKENKRDLNRARKRGLAASFIDRLALDKKRIKAMSDSLRAIARLPDPIGEVLFRTTRPNGIRLQKVRVPLGVVLIIYEARPNVTSDCAGLLLKTSNVGVLRGGRDASCSNKAIGDVLTRALKKSGIMFPAFFIVDRPGHTVVNELLRCEEQIDLVIPRGGEQLIRTVVEHSRIPVIKHYKGICHIFVDKSASLPKALKICVNAKVQRPSVCNAVETILVHEKIAFEFLPRLQEAFNKYRVVMRGDRKARKIIPVIAAREQDWRTEHLGLVVSLRVVKDIEEAIAHINRYGSHHTDSIIATDKTAARRFTNGVDSACCFVNISTRFSDGYEFGFGAEIGISTDKLHARGPMGLEGLTTYKYVAVGNGQIRQ